MTQPTQTVHHVSVHLVIPAIDSDGTPITTAEDAQKYLAQTLGAGFLDWEYVRATDPATGEPVAGTEGLCTPIPAEVPLPYNDGDFFAQED